MIRPDRETFLRQAEPGTIVPVFRELHADLETPVSAYLKVAARFPTDHFLLESVEGGEKWARFSFIGFDPHMRFRAEDREVTVVKDGKTRARAAAGDPLVVLEELLSGMRYRPAPGLPRLSGGAVGYIGYDYVRHTILIVVHAEVREGEDPSASYERCAAAIGEVSGILRGPLPWSDVPDETGGEAPRFAMSREEFLGAVRRAKDHIREGDIIQAVLSNRATVRTRRTPAEVYRVLRALNPSPYMYILRMGDLSVVGSSPEILVRLEGDSVQLRPIAGTRPRGASPDEDRRMEAELLSDPKEIAEHVMLVDLGRNDVGRVAEWGSVKADELMTVERYSHVMHIVSNVVGKLRKGLTAFDVLRAAFPAGTVSGAPKVRAMQIISDLEAFRRGIYAGAVGYFDPQGSMDFCIAIRTIVMTGNEAMIQAGAGIVADSVPEREWDEIMSKARILFRAVGVSPDREAAT